MKRMRWSYLLSTGLAGAALLFVTAAVAASDADSGASPQNPPPVQADQPSSGSEQRALQVGGRITAIDTTAQTITVKGILLSKTIKVGSDAQTAVEGKTGATLGDLKVGDRVQTSCQKQGDSLVAERITLSESREPKGEVSPSAN